MILRMAKLRRRDVCRIMVPRLVQQHRHHRPGHLYPDNDDPWPAAVRECLHICAAEHLRYNRQEQGPRTHPDWRQPLSDLFHNSGTWDLRLRLIHPTRAKQDAHTGHRGTADGVHLHVGGYRRKGDLTPPTEGTAYHPPAAVMFILRDALVAGEHREPNANAVWPTLLRPRPHVPTPVWLVSTEQQCEQAVAQAQHLPEWVLVQHGTGPHTARGLPREHRLLLATGPPMIPTWRYEAGERPADTSHVVVYQRGGPMWLREHLTALKS